MSYHEGSNWQAKKEDENKPLYNTKRKPKLVSDSELIDEALQEAGKILVTAFNLLDATGSIKADIVSSGKKYHITFSEIK